MGAHDQTAFNMLVIKVRDQFILKQVDLTDAVDVFSTIDRERHYLREWLPFVDYTLSVRDTEDFIASLQARSANDSDRVFVIRIADRFAGLIGFKGTDAVNKKSELGYWLSEAYQNRGIMTDAVAALVKFGFEELGLNRIQIKCASGNLKSKKIPVRLGFVLEGTERDGEVLSGGVFTDLEVYSLLKRKDRWQRAVRRD